MATRVRNDFSDETKRNLSARVNHRCSNPKCRAQTSGPQVDPTKALNIGVAAHITAAAPGGPRYDQTITPEQRSGISNAIWLCQNCAKLIDNDSTRYTVEELLRWKQMAEEEANGQIGKTVTATKIDAVIVDKWVTMDYVKKAGIDTDLESQGYRLYWSNNKRESARIDLENWEHVLINQKDGTLARLKIQQGQGYLVLLKKRQEKT